MAIRGVKISFYLGSSISSGEQFRQSFVVALLYS